MRSLDEGVIWIMIRSSEGFEAAKGHIVVMQSITIDVAQNNGLGIGRFS